MKTRHLIWLLPLLLCCKKKSSAPQPAKSEPFTFSASYPSVITTHPNSTALFVFNISVLSGSIDSSPVTCSFSGLPASIQVSPGSIVVTHLLGGVFTISTGDVPIGTNTVNFVIYNKEKGTQTNSIVIKVDPQPDNAPLLTGTYNGSYDYCQPADTLDHYATTVSTVVDTPYEIRIANMKNLGSGFVVTGWVSSTVKIPVQTVGSLTIRGSGTYTKDTAYQMTINDTIVHGADTERCIAHIVH